MALSFNATISVVIADADPEELARTRSLLLQDRGIQILAMAQERSQVLALLDLEPDIFLLAASIEPRDTTTLVKQLLELAPHAQVLLITDDTDPSDMRRAVLAGARGILHKPVTSEDLLSTIHEVYESESARRQRMDQLASQRKAKATRGRVIVVFSPKGGTGCTLLACNVAIALAQATRKRVALVDYSLQFGNIGTLLNLQSIHTVAELAPHHDEIDQAILDNVMVQHPSGVKVLLPPATLDQVELVSTESLVGILEGMRSNFDYVVVDTFHSIEDTTLAIMDFADILLLVTTPEVPALNTVRRFLDSLRNYPHLRHKSQLVVNRHPSKGGVALGEIAESLGLQPIATIPSDGNVVTNAINEGLSVLQLNNPSGFGRNLLKLAEQVALPADLAAVPPTPPPPSGASRLFPLSRRRT
ncbi:MAG TPA: AAA family ATPase [Chloroflexia bacterium]|nr:AAA family ATPase [Chloroflexia bacterium]